MRQVQLGSRTLPRFPGQLGCGFKLFEEAKLKKQKWFTQTVLFKTHLFGKDYFWMQDVDGTVYLAKVDENGNPDLS